MREVTLLVIVILSLAFPEVSMAEFNLGGEKFSGFLSFGLESQYVFSIGIKASDKPRIWQEFSIQHDRSGFYGGASFSESPSKGLDGRGDKDFNFGLVGTAWDHKYNTKLSHIWIATAGPMNELSIRIDGIDHPFYWKGSYLIALRKDSPESGFFNRVGVVKTFSFPLWDGYEQRVTPEAYIGGTIGGAVGVKSGFTHSVATIAFPIALTPKVDLTPKFGYQFTFPNYRGRGKGDISDDNPWWLGLSATWKF